MVDIEIYGGEDVKKIGEYQWMAKLTTVNGICGGVWTRVNGAPAILTAAHCNVTCHDKVFAIGPGGMKAPVGVKAVAHLKCYDDNPIALACDLRLVHPLQVAAGQQLLERGGTVAVDKSVRMLGWGGTPLHHSAALQQCTTRTKELKNCSDWLVASGHSYIATLHKVCAGDANCGLAKGDSGGPLLLENKIAGVASSGSDRKGYDLFTDVSSPPLESREWATKNCAS